MSDTPKTDALIINILGVELPSRDLIRLARMMERELAIRASETPRKKAGRPPISEHIQKKIAQAPQSINDSDLARALKVSIPTVYRYMRMLNKEAA